jgi:uncharacterized membrane protein
LKNSKTAIITGIIFIVAGINHFIMPNFYMEIMPPYLPYPLMLIYLSGVAEVVCGVLLAISKTRKIGAWLTIALLIAIFPANIQMSIDELNNAGVLFYASILRLPLQFLLIYWVYRFTKEIKSKIKEK